MKLTELNNVEKSQQVTLAIIQRGYGAKPKIKTYNQLDFSAECPPRKTWRGGRFHAEIIGTVLKNK